MRRLTHTPDKDKIIASWGPVKAIRSPDGSSVGIDLKDRVGPVEPYLWAAAHIQNYKFNFGFGLIERSFGYWPIIQTYGYNVGKIM